MADWYSHNASRRRDLTLADAQARLADLRPQVAHLPDRRSWPQNTRAEIQHWERLESRLQFEEAERQRLAGMTPSQVVDLAMTGDTTPAPDQHGDQQQGDSDGPPSRAEINALVDDMMERR